MPGRCREPDDEARKRQRTASRRGDAMWTGPDQPPGPYGPRRSIQPDRPEAPSDGGWARWSIRSTFRAVNSSGKPRRPSGPEKQPKRRERVWTVWTAWTGPRPTGPLAVHMLGPDMDRCGPMWAGLLKVIHFVLLIHPLRHVVPDDFLPQLTLKGFPDVRQAWELVAANSYTIVPWPDVLEVRKQFV